MTMKLSEAIRLGAMMRPQAFVPNLHGSSCALEAAAQAMGLKKSQWGEVSAKFPWINNQIGCPEKRHQKCWLSSRKAHKKTDAVEIIIWDLNDNHHWTRERIADWVQSIEPHDPEPAPVPVPAVETVEACHG